MLEVNKHEYGNGHLYYTGKIMIEGKITSFFYDPNDDNNIVIHGSFSDVCCYMAQEEIVRELTGDTKVLESRPWWKKFHK